MSDPEIESLLIRLRFDNKYQKRVDRYRSNYIKTFNQLTADSRLSQQWDARLVSQSHYLSHSRRFGARMRGGGRFGNVFIGMGLNYIVDDSNLRVRLAAGPAVLRTMWRKEMTATAKRVFHGPVTKRIPVRKPSKNKYMDSYGRIRRNWIRPPRSSKGVGNLRKSFRVWGTLEELVISLGGKFSFYAAAIEYGAKPHSTAYVSPTRRHRMGAPIRRWAGGGFSGGFGGYHPLEHGVMEGLPVWIREYAFMNLQFVHYLARGSFNVLMQPGKIRRAEAAGLGRSTAAGSIGYKQNVLDLVSHRNVQTTFKNAVPVAA